MAWTLTDRGVTVEWDGATLDADFPWVREALSMRLNGQIPVHPTPTSEPVTPDLGNSEAMALIALDALADLFGYPVQPEWQGEPPNIQPEPTEVTRRDVTY